MGWPGAGRALGIATLLALAACNRGPARAPVRELNVYNWTGFIEPSVIADFEKEYGIKVHYDVYDSNEMMEVKLLAGHTNYDIVVPGGSFFEKELKAGVYRRLDKGLLPNLVNLDPGAVREVDVLDPDGAHGVDYMWLVTVGLGYDAAKVAARAPAASVDSWRLLFDPQVAAKLEDCGISVLDSPDDVVGAALAFLGKDPNSESLADLDSAEKLLQPLRPHLRYVDSARYFADLANGDLCLVLGWSGDVAQARQRARDAANGVRIEYSIPVEGSLSIVDVLAIPADAPHVADAHRFINYLLRPDVAAKNSSAVTYASGVAGSRALLSDALRNDTIMFPAPQSRARLVPMRARSADYTRALMRMWTRFKTGQ
jgi:putrescine transport system substrate-binding protein